MLLRDILWRFSKILFKSLFQYMTFPNLRTEYKWEESVHIRSSSWSKFSRIQPKYGKHVPKTSELGTFQAVVYAGEKVDKAVTPFSVSNNFLGKLAFVFVVPETSTTQKMKFSIKVFFRKCDQIRSILIENFTFCETQSDYSKK